MAFLSTWLVPFAGSAEAPDQKPEAPGQRMIEEYLRQKAVRLDSKFLGGIQTKEDWEKVRPALRREYLEMLGLWPLPEKTPLEAKVTGVVERAEGFRIEKLHFQSRPRLYVTGNLYLPREVKEGEKLPAVLYVCGHSGRGRDGNKTSFQHHGMWFATHGYVCLMIDTLQLGEIAGIHHGTYRYDRWWWQALGYTPAGVECWNGIRALDYLETRPEVDPRRFAVTGISGGGAATFWISAADERVKVAVPVSGMADLEDYVGAKVVNGHCDCMFLVNTHRRPWTNIAALVAPRPLLFENSGHDPIFPMDANDRVRSRLESLYRLYTPKPEDLFDIGVTPGGHSDNPELRLMAYRWINRHLKGDNSPVTEPELKPEEGKLLRAFPEDLPRDERNTKIDESFVAAASFPLPESAASFLALRDEKLAELRRLSFGALPSDLGGAVGSSFEVPVSGELSSEAGVRVAWKYFPPKGPAEAIWVLVLDREESLEAKPAWAASLPESAGILAVAPRGTGPTRWGDPAPYYIQRSLALLGETVDGGRVVDVLAVLLEAQRRAEGRAIKIAGRGRSGVIAAYAALLAPEPLVKEALLVDPPATHREGPIFLNVLRVLDVPDALGFLAPRPLRILTGKKEAFERTARMYATAGGELQFGDLLP